MSAEIANTIAQQLGGIGMIRMLTGAKIFAAERGLVLKFPRAGVVMVTLDYNDTYAVTHTNRNGRELNKASDVYCDQLKGVIERFTGLYLSF